jgi:hypothetical protein
MMRQGERQRRRAESADELLIVRISLALELAPLGEPMTNPRSSSSTFGRSGAFGFLAGGLRVMR